jgi:hypothetical protein
MAGAGSCAADVDEGVVAKMVGLLALKQSAWPYEGLRDPANLTMDGLLGLLARKWRADSNCCLNVNHHTGELVAKCGNTMYVSWLFKFCSRFHVTITNCMLHFAIR